MYIFFPTTHPESVVHQFMHAKYPSPGSLPSFCITEVSRSRRLETVWLSREVQKAGLLCLRSEVRSLLIALTTSAFPLLVFLLLLCDHSSYSIHSFHGSPFMVIPVAPNIPTKYPQCRAWPDSVGPRKRQKQ